TGVQRLRVLEWLTDDPYPRAVGEPWPDPDAGDLTREDVAPVRERVEGVLQLAADAGLQVRTGPFAAPSDPVAGLYQLGAIAPIGPSDRHRLLAAPTALERLTRLTTAIDEVESSLQFRLNPPDT